MFSLPHRLSSSIARPTQVSNKSSRQTPLRYLPDLFLAQTKPERPVGQEERIFAQQGIAEREGIICLFIRKDGIKSKASRSFDVKYVNVMGRSGKTYAYRDRVVVLQIVLHMMIVQCVDSITTIK